MNPLKNAEYVAPYFFFEIRGRALCLHWLCIKRRVDFKMPLSTDDGGGKRKKKGEKIKKTCCRRIPSTPL
jgi:hypothetical protein